MSASTRRFARHYVEMVVAMFAGMGVLLPPLGLATRALFGVGLHGNATLMISAMALTMTVPMVAWMRFRGHGWAPCADMTAAMVLPTLAVLALLWADLLGDVGTLLLIEHAVMLPAMLVAMLLRRDEYTGRAHAANVPEVAA
jgi:hypothetical protein